MFTERAKTIALAIVKIFETSKPFGDYSAVAILNDGAGISYGTSQFTHKSGSLAKVIKRYLLIAGELPEVVSAALGDLTTRANIPKHSKNEPLKAALKKLGKTPEMQQAQREIAFENYLKPALEACEGSDFVYPLSLAVIYDSLNHGSYARIRDKVKVDMPGNGSMKPEEFEQEWITEYVRQRNAWLNSIARLKSTAYRTKFFKTQIDLDNWNLDLPMIVHGYKVTESLLFPKVSTAPANPASSHEVNSADDTLKQEVQSGPSIPQGQTQIAENIVNTGPPSLPLPEDKDVSAPTKDGTTGNAAKMTIAGIVVPGFIVAIIKSIQDLIAQGYVSASEVGSTVLGFIRDNQRYVFLLIGLLILLLIVKKLVKQITFWIEMLTKAIPGWNNITVIPTEVIPVTKRWWEIWK